MKQLTIIEQRDNNEFTFYDNYLGTILRKFDGFEYATVVDSIDDISGPYGAAYVNSKFGKRQVTIEGDLVDEDVYAMRRLLSKAIRQTGVMKLWKFTTYDDLNLQFECEITKVTNPYTHQVHTFQIQAIAPDWRFYSQDLHTFDISQTLVRGGLSIPSDMPMSFSSPSSNDTAVSNIVENAGNEDTDPIFTITGPGTNFIISNITAGKTFTLSRTLSDSDVVVIDVKERTAILNGVTNVYDDLDGDFWSLVPGENEIRFLIESGIDVSLTNLNISYRDAYSGI